MSDIAAIFLLSFFGSIVALAGGIVFLLSKKWSASLAEYSIPFASGVLLTASLIGMLPEAVHGAGEGAFLIALFSFLVSYIFEHFLFSLHHHDCKHEKHAHYVKSVPLVIVGDTIHNFVDGVAIAASYLVNPGLGIVVTISTFLHEVPHEIGDFGILLKAGWNRKGIILVNALSASTTILGAFLVFFLVPSESVVGILLAIAAGMFLYLGASDFLPHIPTDKKDATRSLAVLLIGVLIMLITLKAVPHSHGGDDGHAHKEVVAPQNP